MNEQNKFNYLDSYARTTRLILIDRLALNNSYEVPEISFIVLSVSLSNLEDFDSSRIAAGSFLLRLMSDQKPYIIRFGLFQTFKEKKYDVIIQVSLRERSRRYKFLSLFGGAIIPALTKKEAYPIFSFRNLRVVANFAVKNLSFIRVIETHSAFFRWRGRLDVRLHSNTDNIDLLMALLDNIKCKKIS